MEGKVQFVTGVERKAILQGFAQKHKMKKENNTKIEDKMEIGEIQVETREEIEVIQRIQKKVPQRNEEKETHQALHQRVNLKEREKIQNQDLLASTKKETQRKIKLPVVAVAEAKTNAKVENTKEAEALS